MLTYNGTPIAFTIRENLINPILIQESCEINGQTLRIWQGCNLTPSGTEEGLFLTVD